MVPKLGATIGGFGGLGGIQCPAYIVFYRDIRVHAKVIGFTRPSAHTQYVLCYIGYVTENGFLDKPPSMAFYRSRQKSDRGV